MTKTSTASSHCPETSNVTEDVARENGWIDADVSIYGRKVCIASDCHGYAFSKKDGTLGKHKRGANRNMVH